MRFPKRSLDSVRYLRHARGGGAGRISTWDALDGGDFAIMGQGPGSTPARFARTWSGCGDSRKGCPVDEDGPVDGGVHADGRGPGRRPCTACTSGLSRRRRRQGPDSRDRRGLTDANGSGVGMGWAMEGEEGGMGHRTGGSMSVRRNFPRIIATVRGYSLRSVLAAPRNLLVQGFQSLHGPS